MFLRYLFTLFIFIFYGFHNLATQAQKIGGGELNPGLYTNQQAINNFQNQKIGVSIHWGPNSLLGKEISWSRGEETTAQAYDNLYKKFNPTKFDATTWTNLFSAFGAKYIIVTSKHHDGFSMWHSDFSNYDIENTPFKRDYLHELREACHKQGITFGTYYSTLDWYHPDYQPYGHGGPGDRFEVYNDTPNYDRYLIYVKNQIRELVTKYHSEIIQFDGDWDSTWTHRIGSDMYLYIRYLKDDILINNRTDKGRYSAPRFPNKGSWRADIYAGDFEERERLTTNFVKEQPKVLGKSQYPWQAWVTLDRSQWSWKKDFKFMSSQELIIDLLKTIGDGGNYLINLGPRPDGSFEKSARQILLESGQWIKEHQEGIYGTKAGPFFKEGLYTSTFKDNVAHLYLFNFGEESLKILCKQSVRAVHTHDGEPVPYTHNNGYLVIRVAQKPIEHFKLTLD